MSTPYLERLAREKAEREVNEELAKYMDLS